MKAYAMRRRVKMRSCCCNATVVHRSLPIERSPRSGERSLQEGQVCPLVGQSVRHIHPNHRRRKLEDETFEDEILLRQAGGDERRLASGAQSRRSDDSG